MSTYQQRLGERLRAIRTQRGMTLQDVEERSSGHWKAVVVGSYERGDRAVTVSRLSELADFYGVPMAELLPERRPVRDAAPAPRVAIDLSTLSADGVDPQLAPLSRFARTIQLQRGDFRGRVLTLRGADVRALAVVYGTSPEDLVEQLADSGVLA